MIYIVNLCCMLCTFDALSIIKLHGGLWIYITEAGPYHNELILLYNGVGGNDDVEVDRACGLGDIKRSLEVFELDRQWAFSLTRTHLSWDVMSRV